MKDDRLRHSLEDLFSDLSPPEPEGAAEPVPPPSPPAEKPPPPPPPPPAPPEVEEQPPIPPPTPPVAEVEEEGPPPEVAIPRTIIAARVTNIRARLIGSLLITLAVLLLIGVLYTVSFHRLSRAIVTLEIEALRAGAIAPDRQGDIIAEIEAARQAMSEAPVAWGLLVVIASVSAAAITLRSIAQPMERITEATARLAAGHLDERVPVEWADEFGRLATAFNEMAERLQTSYARLEQQVAERTRALQEANYALQRRAIHLEASTEIARAITSIFDINQLLRRTVDLIRDHFGFYHAGIFLLDETGEWAVLQEATGEAGARMKAQSHRLRLEDTSMVGWTALHRQPRIALDVGEDAVHFANPLLPYTRSEVTLPLMVGGRLLGVLDVQSTEEAAFDEDDVRTLQSMADQIAIAIENARRVSEEAALLEATSPIYRASRRLTTATTTDEVADAIIASVAETGADGCAVVSFDFSPEGEPVAMYYAGVWRRDREPRFKTGMRLPIAESPLPLEMVNSLWTIPDVSRDDRLPASTLRLFQETGVAAVANIPLRIRDRVIGQVVVLRTTPGPFSEVAIRLYETLGDQAAVALERARLTEEAQQRAQREQLARQITEQIRRASDMKRALQTTAAELSRALAAPYVSIELNIASPEQE